MRVGAVCILFLYTTIVSAGTFVGNGGSEGDVELAVTMMQIREAFDVVAKMEGETDSLCVCNRVYDRSPLCEPLRSLTQPQVGFCRTALIGQAAAVRRLVSQRDNIPVRWTHARIEVIERGQTRAADAVTNRKTGEITLNLTAFRRMGPAERVFLLTHEILHLTELEGRPMEDVGEVGPYSGEDGGRNLINAMAASVSVLHGEFPKEIRSYKAKRHRSQAWKPFWIGFDAGTSAFAERETSYRFKRYDRVGILGRYQWTHWGVVVGVRQNSQDKKVLGSVKVEEQVDILSLGVSYRLFFAEDPLTFWGQSYVLLQAAVEQVSARLKVHEEVAGVGETIGEEDNARVAGGALSAYYYAPLFWGIWGQVAVSYELHPYKFNKFGVEHDQGLVSMTGGLSYGF